VIDLNTWSDALAALPYPPQKMQCVDRGITGSGFYPGARNCFFGHEDAPRVMLLGRDFGTLSYYAPLAREPGRNEHALTWRHTQNLYVRPLYGAFTFCTNYLMGVRVDGSAKGDLSERLTTKEWRVFEAACWEFLQMQIAEIKPRLVVVFGADNQRDLIRKDRLGQPSRTVLYAPHPHSAIGERNAEPHRLVCSEIKTRLSI
jgi:hypothetical protein